MKTIKKVELDTINPEEEKHVYLIRMLKKINRDFSTEVISFVFCFFERKKKV